MALEGLRDLDKKTEKGSPEPLASTSSKCYSQQTPVKPQWIGISLKNNESLDEFTKSSVIQRRGQSILLAKEGKKYDGAGVGGLEGCEETLYMAKDILGSKARKSVCTQVLTGFPEKGGK